MRGFVKALGVIAIASTAPAQESNPELLSAIALADQGDFPAAFDQIAPGDATAHSLVTWLRLRSGRAAFADYLAYLEDHPDWPSRSRLRTAAERTIPKGLNPVTVVAFFAEEAPQTGEGAVRLAEALTAQGEIDDAKDVIVTAWTDLRLQLS